MKLCIRGDRNTGKSALLARLQGQPFVEEYHATEEIQVASINWSYKNTEDIVKVEVWDVVDVAKKRVMIEGLKTTETESGPGMEPGLDAEFIENFSRPGKETAEIRWAECSLRNGFGLKFLHRFFNVPFLTLQRQSLLRQLEVNSRDIAATQQELDLYMETEEANYQLFADSKTATRRAQAEQAAPAPSSSIVAGQPSNMVEVRPVVPIPDISYSNKSSPSLPTTLAASLPSPSLPSPSAPSLPTQVDASHPSHASPR